MDLNTRTIPNWCLAPKLEKKEREAQRYLGRKFSRKTNKPKLLMMRRKTMKLAMTKSHPQKSPPSKEKKVRTTKTNTKRATAQEQGKGSASTLSMGCTCILGVTIGLLPFSTLSPLGPALTSLLLIVKGMCEGGQALTPTGQRNPHQKGRTHELSLLWRLSLGLHC